MPAALTSAAVPTTADVNGTAAGGSGVSSIAPLEGAVVPPGTFPPAEALPSVSAGNLRLLGDAPGLEYDLSPDGVWTAAIRNGEICLAPVADPLTANCTAPPDGLGPYTRGSWSPTGDAVVVMTDPFSEDGSAVQVVRTNGSVIPVIPAGDELDVPFDALFVDQDRLLVVSLRRYIRATALTVIDVAAGTSGSMGAYTGPDGSPWFADRGPEFEQQPENDAPVFALFPAAGGDPVLVPNRADRVQRDAELAPDGRYLAVLSLYVGDDTDVRDSALYQFSVASVASILAGEPDWADLAGLSQAALAGDVSILGSSIVWTDSGLILLEMSDGVHALHLVPTQ